MTTGIAKTTSTNLFFLWPLVFLNLCTQIFLQVHFHFKSMMTGTISNIYTVISINFMVNWYLNHIYIEVANINRMKHYIQSMSLIVIMQFLNIHFDLEEFHILQDSFVDKFICINSPDEVHMVKIGQWHLNVQYQIWKFWGKVYNILKNKIKD